MSEHPPIYFKDCIALESGSAFEPFAKRCKDWIVWEPRKSYCLMIEITSEAGAVRDLRFVVQGFLKGKFERKEFKGRMEADQANFGKGLRWWWTCPVCKKRVRTLYLIPDRLVPLCRFCRNVKYRPIVDLDLAVQSRRRRKREVSC